MGRVHDNRDMTSLRSFICLFAKNLGNCIQSDSSTGSHV